MHQIKIRSGKLIFKIIQVTYCIATNLNCMSARPWLSKNFRSARSLSYHNESNRVAGCIEALSLALQHAGFKKADFVITVTNRIEQRNNVCAKRFCPYPRHAYPEIFACDPTAACLCTRYGPFDTKDYFIQARRIDTADENF